ncbi:MAG TPA: MFS transporter [Dehalococcoidia bacterium]|nr:MFS transporter [Dehalococcoidia bacterium]HIK88767.1 MFS transporter [Dehalococcoidia bacterium]
MSSPPNEPPATPPGPVRSSVRSTIRSLVWAVYVPSFLLSVGQGILIPVLPGFAKQEMAAAIGLIGIVIAARHIGTMIFDVPAGILVTRMGLRRTMTAGVVLFGVAAVWAGISPNVTSLIAARVLTGISFALWSISRHTYIAAAVPMDVRGRALSLFGGISRIATILGPLLGGLLAEFVGIRVPFFAQAVVAILTLIVVISTTRNMIEPPRSKARHNVFAELGTVVSRHRRDFATAGVAAVALQFLRAGREFLIPVWGGELGLGEAKIGYIATASFAVDSMLFPLVGYSMDRWGRKSTGLPAFIVLALAIALIPLTGSFGALLAVGLIAGLGNGLSSGFVLIMGTDLSPRENPGEFLGVWRLISDTGGASGPIAIGGIAQILTLGVASFATAGVGVFGALMLIFFVKETMTRTPRPVPPPRPKA